MNDSRHEKAWNDPPLFSLDQMSRASNPNVVNRRLRYPQQVATNPMSNPMSNPMNNQMNNQMNPMTTSNPQMMATNPLQNQPSYGQPSQQTNPNINNFDPVFDVNAFLYSVQMTITQMSNHLPQELVHKWQSIQNYIYGVPIESQTKLYFQYLLQSIQKKDLNNCRLYLSYLSNDSNETIRTIALTLNQIFSYFP